MNGPVGKILRDVSLTKVYPVKVVIDYFAFCLVIVGEKISWSVPSVS